MVSSTSAVKYNALHFESHTIIHVGRMSDFLIGMSKTLLQRWIVITMPISQ